MDIEGRYHTWRVRFTNANRASTPCRQSSSTETSTGVDCDQAEDTSSECGLLCDASTTNESSSHSSGFLDESISSTVDLSSATMHSDDFTSVGSGSSAGEEVSPKRVITSIPIPVCSADGIAKTPFRLHRYVTTVKFLSFRKGSRFHSAPSRDESGTRPTE